MSTLLNLDGVTVTDDALLLADDSPLPPQGSMIVSLARWQAEHSTLATHPAPVAVKLPNTTDVLSLDAAVLALPLLVLDFPGFADGRAYSQARRLRERCGYQGTLRASGAAVVADQLAMMARVGITQFLLRDDQSVAVCQAALSAGGKPMPYQPAQDASHAVFAARRA